MQLTDHQFGPTIARLDATLAVAFVALRKGLELTEAIYAQAGWNPKTDPHHFSHTVRREALEVFKAEGMFADDDEDASSPMSALHLKVGDTDALRIWRANEGEARVPSSESGLKFLKQPASGAPFLPGFEDEEVPKRCRTVLLWEHKRGQLSRFTLLRPLYADAGRVVSDWREPLLLRYAETVEDVQYRRRDMGAAGVEVAS